MGSGDDSQLVLLALAEGGCGGCDKLRNGDTKSDGTTSDLLGEERRRYLLYCMYAQAG